MRSVKICLVLFFGLLALAPAVTPRVAALDALLGQRNGRQGQNHSTPPDADQYVGSTACAECHTNESAHYTLTAHRKTDFDGARVNERGCEACHGPAKQHLDFYLRAQNLMKEGKEAEANALYADEAKARAAKMRSFAELTPAESSAVCLKCHEGTQGRSEERFNYRRSEHFKHGVSCQECHSSHSPKRTEFLLRAPEPNMCYQCHAEQKASFTKPFHHKVPEGGMKCSDCHNHHGGFAQKSLRNSVTGDSTCLKCHADKQGPFVYEHAPVKVEGCQACHTPHGSTYPKLLTRPEVRLMCIECHSNTPGIPDTDGTGIGPGTPSFHDITNPRYANCTTCHVEIHGSNKDPFFR
jgi:DmsE family decaheme c-type cytochrome